MRVIFSRWLGVRGLTVCQERDNIHEDRPIGEKLPITLASSHIINTNLKIQR
jgi:hypothetical protein